MAEVSYLGLEKATVVTGSKRLELTPRIRDAIKAHIDALMDTRLEEIKASGQPIPPPDEIAFLKRAYFEAEIETYEVCYLIKSQAVDKKIQELTSK